MLEVYAWEDFYFWKSEVHIDGNYVLIQSPMEVFTFPQAIDLCELSFTLPEHEMTFFNEHHKVMRCCVVPTELRKYLDYKDNLLVPHNQVVYVHLYHQLIIKVGLFMQIYVYLNNYLNVFS